MIPAKRFPLIGAVPPWCPLGIMGLRGRLTGKGKYDVASGEHGEAAAPVCRGFANNTAKSLEPCKRHLVLNKQWALVEMEFLGRLDEVLKQKTKTKQEAWANEMHNLSKATKWIKQSCPPQLLGGWEGCVS